MGETDEMEIAPGANLRGLLRRPRVDLRGLGKLTFTSEGILPGLPFAFERFRRGEYRIDVLRLDYIVDVWNSARDRGLVEWFRGLPLLVALGDQQAGELAYLMADERSGLGYRLGFLFNGGRRFFLGDYQTFRLLGVCVNLPSASQERGMGYGRVGKPCIRKRPVGVGQSKAASALASSSSSSSSSSCF